MSTPVQSTNPELVRALLLIEQPVLPEDERRIPVQFNPTEYQLQKQNTFAEIPIPGLETPPIQYIRGASEKLTTELLVDTSDTMEDVRELYVARIRGLLDIQSELHAPPIVQLIWDTDVFRGVVESLSVTYTMFRPDGRPVRAKLQLALKEYRPVEVQVRERPKLSPDFDKTYRVVAGDTPSGVAGKVYRKPGEWRAIMVANGIVDPRRLEPGTVLAIPKLR